MRSITIDHRLAKRPLLDVLQSSFHLKRKAALDALRQKQVRICGGVCVDPTRRVRGGQTIQLEADAQHEKKQVSGSDQIMVRYVDDHVIVVEKPAGLTTVRHADEVASIGARKKKFLPSTLVDLMPGVLARQGTPAKG